MKTSELIKKWKAEGLSDAEIKKKLAALRKKKQSAAAPAEKPVKAKRPPVQLPPEKPKASKAGLIAMILALVALGGVGMSMNSAGSGIDFLKGELAGISDKLDENQRTNKDVVAEQANLINKMDERIKHLESVIDKAMESRVGKDDIPTIMKSYRHQVIDKAKRSVIYISAGMSQGSGFFAEINGKYLGVTNCHVVDDLNEVEIMTWDEKWATCRVIARDAATDLALLEVMSVERGKLKDDEGKMPPPAAFADSDKVRVGDPCFAMGAPHGDIKTATAGQISNVRRYLGGLPILDQVSGLYNTYIQIDAGVMPGNSGGPTFNDRGEVIGINTRANHNNETSGYVLPMNFCKERLENLLESPGKRNTYNSLGFDFDPYFRRRHETPQTRVLPSDQETGFIASRVFEDSPAYEAGFRTADVILRINGERVNLSTDADIVEFRRKIAFGSPGTEYTFKVRSYPEFDKDGNIMKESEDKEIKVKVLDEETYRLPIPIPMLRVYINKLPDDEIPADRPGGVKIVTPFNLFDLRAHVRNRRSVIIPFQKNDIIVGINDENIRNPGDLVKTLKELEDVRQIPDQVTIVRDGKETPIKIKK